MTTSTASISVFVPMYNEEANAGILLPLLRDILSELTSDFEIVIVDDASRDRTVALIEDYMKLDSRIRLIRHKTNLGYGAALRTGFLSVNKDIVFYTDADVPIDFAILRDVVPQMAKEATIIGYRKDRQDTVKRWVFSKVYNVLLRVLFDVRVRDVNFSFKVFQKSVVDQFKNLLKAESVFIDGEILIWLVRLGIPIKEWPIDYTPRKHGLSTLGTYRQALLTLKEIWKFYAREKKRQATDALKEMRIRFTRIQPPRG